MVDKISGIYRIVCVKNGRYYYGSSVNINKRWYEHKRQLRKGTHSNPIIQQYWNKHGEDLFRFELIELISKNKLLDIEQKYLNEHVGKSNCMNIADNAQNGFGHGECHISIRKEVRDKLSKAAKRQWAEGRGVNTDDAAWRKKVSDGRKRYWKENVVARNKMSKVMKGNKNAKRIKL